MTTLTGSSFRQRPGTRLGWWAVGLAAAFGVMFMINAAVLMPLNQTGVPDTGLRQALLASFGIVMLLCGLAGGVLGLVALIRKHERSWLVWLTVMPGALVLFLLLGELLVPH
jgi:hypothetical protein